MMETLGALLGHKARHSNLQNYPMAIQAYRSLMQTYMDLGLTKEQSRKVVLDSIGFPEDTDTGIVDKNLVSLKAH